MDKKEKVFCKDCKYKKIVPYTDFITCGYTIKVKRFNYKVGEHYKDKPVSTSMNKNGECKFYQQKPTMIEKILNFRGFRWVLNYIKENQNG